MVTLTFKATPDEARRIRRQARRENLTLSEYLRRRATAPARPGAPVSPHLTRCPHTGALVYAGLDDQPPLTTERVRELLGDFP
jgi:hypothetical protein